MNNMNYRNAARRPRAVTKVATRPTVSIAFFAALGAIAVLCGIILRTLL